MALAFVRSASAINQMSDIAFFANYGETTRVVDFFAEPADAVAGRIFDLYQRHAAVCRVFDDALTAYARYLREGSLPANCLPSLIVSRREGDTVYPAAASVPQQAVVMGQDIRIAIDPKQRRVLFERWDILGGVSAELIIALSEPFRQATRDELAPEHYPFIKTVDLATQTMCNSDETLRRRILRCRKDITKLAGKAGDPPPSFGAVIESVQRHGYRLNPDRVRLVSISELSGSE